ncbi:CMGC/SRPK protein kinase [Coprinopsis cinerea AmutBmut pab1-1]|nr:CMGC/SRPK protein kinase [Coprinopsis cinerea AmutBmut pab1-1]
MHLARVLPTMAIQTLPRYLRLSFLPSRFAVLPSTRHVPSRSSLNRRNLTASSRLQEHGDTTQRRGNGLSMPRHSSKDSGRPLSPGPSSEVDSLRYFPAQLNTVLRGNPKITVIRKLGSGPRSSTWLVKHIESSTYSALKIYTAAASREERGLAEEKRLVELRDVMAYSSGYSKHPCHFSTWWEESTRGRHLCYLVEPYCGLSLEDVRNGDPMGRLPIRTVQFVFNELVEKLSEVHGFADGMHGSLSAENAVFWTWADVKYLKPHLSLPEGSTIDGVAKIKAQPLMQVENPDPKSTDDLPTVMKTWQFVFRGFEYALFGF